MLKLRLPKSATCRFGSLLYGNDSSPDPSFLSAVDPVLRCCQRAYILMGPVSMHRLFGYNYPKDETQELDRGFIHEGEYNGWTDWLRYGSTLQTARSVLRSDLNGSKFDGSGEHEVYHAQSFGDVIPSWGSNLVTITPLQNIGDTVRPPTPLMGHGYRIANSPRQIQSVRGTYYPSYTAISGDDLNLDEHFPAILVHNKLLFGRYSQHSDLELVHTDSAFGGTRYMTCRDVRWTLNDMSFDLAYELSVQETGCNYYGYGYEFHGSYQALKFDVNLHVDFSFTREDGKTIPPSSETLYFQDALIGHEKWSYQCTQTNEIVLAGMYNVTSGGYRPVPGSLTTWTNRTYTHLTTSLFTGTAVRPPSSALSACTLYSRERYLIEGKFKSWFELNLPEIRAACALSSAAAMSDLQASTDTDLLQTLAKIPEIATQLPNIRAAIKIVRDLAHRELHPGEILDFLSQLRLQQSFQWRPEFDLLTKYLPKIAAVILSFSGKGNTISGRGRYDYDFLSEECYRTAHLTVRTKIVAANSFSDLAATYLKLDSLGILPTPANIWDMIPFSFVVNWFTNMGKRIRVLGTLANMWLLSPVVIVHSYELTSVFTPAELESMQLREAPGAESVISMKIYKREITRYVPLLGHTHFDFERPTGTPDWSVVASLLWQWMK